MAGVTPKRNVFVAKNIADPTIKKWKKNFPQPQISIKNKYPFLVQNFTKGYRSVVALVLYHFCDMRNFLQSKVSCCLHMYFLRRHHLPPDKSENDQDDSD
jgi:hypothetical protein